MIPDLLETAKQMKERARYLLKYEKTREDREDLDFFKTRQISLAGYDLIINFSIDNKTYSEFETHFLQIYNKYQPFVPFWLLCDTAAAFLGEKELSLTEYIIYGRKLYVWCVALTDDGKAVPVMEDDCMEKRQYGKLNYFYNLSTLGLPNKTLCQ